MCEIFVLSKMNFLLIVVCVIYYLKIDASASPVTKRDIGYLPVEVGAPDKIYLLPNTLKENDEINVTGTIENRSEWWWAVRLLAEDSETVVCDIKGNITSNTITINSEVEDFMNADDVFLDFTFIIDLKITDVPRQPTKKQFSIKFRETIVDLTCVFDSDMLTKIKYIAFDGYIQKVNELRFKLA